MFHGHLMLHFSLSKGVWGCLNEPLLHRQCGSPQTKGTLVTRRPLWGRKAIVTGTGQSGRLCMPQCPMISLRLSGTRIQGPVSFD